MSKTRDEVLDEEIERAMAPWVDKLPADLLDFMREELALYATTHPVGSQLLERAVPPPSVDRSGDVPIDGAASVDDVAVGDCADVGKKPR